MNFFLQKKSRCVMRGDMILLHFAGERRGRMFCLRGAATIEFLALGGILISLLFSLPILGELASVNSNAEQASRYVAWELTVGKTDSTKLAGEVDRRFFAASGGNQSVAPLGAKAAALGQWSRDESTVQSGRVGSVETGEVTVLLDNGAIPSKAGGLLVNGVETLGAMQSFIPDAKWDLQSRGLYNVVVQSNLGSSRFLSGGTGKDCAGQEDKEIYSCLRHNNAILVDAWMARDASQVEERTKALVPLGILKYPLGKPLDALSRVLPFVVDLHGIDKAFGEVRPDILPPDRYGN